jgi:hypothetical protein
LRDDPFWRPWHNHHGEHLRILTDQQEQELIGIITENWLEVGKWFTNDDFRVLCMEFWLEIVAELGSEERQREYIENHPFACSDGFISDFKRTRKFSSRRGRPKRRAGIVQAIIDDWRSEMMDALEEREATLDRIVNCDETSWLVIPGFVLTWAPKGAESIHVQMPNGGREKERITVHASITAEGKKLPLMFIAEGKTGRVERSQLGDIGENWADHSPSGWQTQETFIRYLHLLRAHYNDKKPIYLILDQYSVHRTAAVKAATRRENIELFFIPASCTDALQPLDRRVFGVLKAMGKHEYHTGERLGLERTKKQACQDMLTAWDELGEEVLKSAWSHLFENYYEEFGDNDDEELIDAGDDGNWFGAK